MNLMDQLTKWLIGRRFAADFLAICGKHGTTPPECGIPPEEVGTILALLYEREISREESRLQMEGLFIKYSSVVEQLSEVFEEALIASDLFLQDYHKVCEKYEITREEMDNALPPYSLEIMFNLYETRTTKQEAVIEAMVIAYLPRSAKLRLTKRMSQVTKVWIGEAIRKMPAELRNHEWQALVFRASVETDMRNENERYLIVLRWMGVLLAQLGLPVDTLKPLATGAPSLKGTRAIVQLAADLNPDWNLLDPYELLEDLICIKL